LEIAPILILTLHFHYLTYIIFRDGHIVGNGGSIVIGLDLVENRITLKDRITDELKTYYPDGIFTVIVSALQTELTQEEAQIMKVGWTIE